MRHVVFLLYSGYPKSVRETFVKRRHGDVPCVIPLDGGWILSLALLLRCSGSYIFAGFSGAIDRGQNETAPCCSHPWPAVSATSSSPSAIK